MLHRGMIAIAALAACGAAFCQVHVYGENEGPWFENARSMGGPNLLVGIKFTPPNSEVITRLEIFTGERTGANSLGIWTHNAVQNRPGTLLTQTSWSMSSANSWQGVNIPGGFPIAGGTTYWLVWAPINASQASWELNGPQTQQYRGSFDGGQSWNGPFNGNWKFRLFAPRAITPAGTPQPGANVSLGILSPRDANLNYVMGASFGSTPGIPLGPDGRPIPLNVDALLVLSLSLPAVFQDFIGALDGSGAATAVLAVPNVGALVGLQMHVAYVTLQVESSSGIKSISDPLLLTIQP